MHPGTTVAALLVAIPFLTAPDPALAKGRFGHGGPGGPHLERFLEREAEALGLDAETTAAIRQVLEQGRERARELEDARRDARSVMHDLLSQDAPDEEAVMRQAETIGEIEIEQSKHRLKALLQVHALLTPEQRALLREKRGRRREALFESCAADLEAFCPEAEPGPERFRCLRSHRDDVSTGCRETMRERRRRGPRTPW